MKIIIDPTLTTAPYDNVTSCVASTEDADFPDENMRDNFTKNVWKATGSTATIQVQCNKGSSVCIINTNATSVVIKAGSGDSYTPESGFAYEAGFVDADDEVATIVVSDLSGEHGLAWADYSEFTLPHLLTIELETDGDPVEVGVLRAGNVEEFADPAYNHSESSIDFSIEKELNNGADYFKKRNVVRVFDNLEMIETRVNAWKFKHDIFDYIGPQPVVIRMVQNDNITDDEFVAYVKRSEPPRLQHLTISHTRINYSLKEAI